ncbi:DEAD/DEAH box helicase [Halorhodospira halochloris]|uniref:helicase-related protein n=1 Tax=Halorhodospira halochloris TaxID=1052 RepID=UPI001EE7CB19|nr:helicase-related protein [Halorhodospira halochloris]MCG5530459.1 DEAD/DEAH box helicase [Halorhodospira halochloris]
MLPIDELRDEFVAALSSGHVIVTAPTGSGKSTRLPVWAAEKGPVMVVEPRRVAATSLAGYVADSLDCQLGDAVGYSVRLDKRMGERTRILFVTPGVALRWRAAGRLEQFQSIIIDEFHERRWDTDLLVALLKADAQQRLVLTSATIDGQVLTDYLGATLLEAQGCSYAVDTEYLSRQARDMPSSRGLAERVVQGVKSAWQRTAGDVLVFLPGRGEIEKSRHALQGFDAEVTALHASASLNEQQRALNQSESRRIVLATNVAETSLTVPGVTAVVDSGLERRTLRRNGRTVLALQPVSQAAADQRSGRAGRVAPGLCLRLWGKAAPLARRTPPEVQREDLTELVLAAACAGYPAERLQFPDSPRQESFEKGQNTLTEIGALDEQGRVTQRGRQLFALPVEPIHAHLVVAMPDTSSACFMVDLVAALAAGGSWVRSPQQPRELDKLEQHLGRRCDATLLVAVMRGYDLPAVKFDRRARDESRRLARQLGELLSLPLDRQDSDVEEENVDLSKIADSAFSVVPQAFPEMVYVRRAKRRHAMGNGHDEVAIDERSLLSESAEAALVLNGHSVPGKGTRQTVTVVNCLAPLSMVHLANAGIGDVVVENPDWDGEKLTAQEQRIYAGRVIDSRSIEPEGEQLRQAAARLILAGDLLAPAGERLQDDLEAWELYVALGNAAGHVPQADEWLLERLHKLGVEQGDDLLLLEAQDLRFDGIPWWEREDFDARYPRRVNLPDLQLRIHYNVRRNELVAEKIAGIRRDAPKRWELPAWRGWKIKYQSASRVVEVK